MSIHDISEILILVCYVYLAFRCRKYRKRIEELERDIERIPYEMCLNCDKSK